MNFFFLRHTSLNIGKDIFYGQTDVDVSKKFNKELKNIKIKLTNENIVSFISLLPFTVESTASNAGILSVANFG